MQPVRLILKLASKGAGTRKHTDLPSFVVENRFSPCLDPKLDGSAQSCKQQVLRLLTASRDSGDSEQSRLLLGPPQYDIRNLCIWSQPEGRGSGMLLQAQDALCIREHAAVAVKNQSDLVLILVLLQTAPGPPKGKGGCQWWDLIVISIAILTSSSS